MQDCGLIVDKLTAESQVYGGIIGAINFALYEDRILDRVTGQMVNPNMEWYLVAGMSDVPKIDIILNNMPERGVIGIGEPPTVSTAAAIANAVSNATGVTIRSLPLTPAEGARRARAGKSRRDAVKAFAYVNPANEKEAVGALTGRPRQGDADRRRAGSARADEGLRRAARSPRQRQERARRDDRQRRPTAA